MRTVAPKGVSWELTVYQRDESDNFKDFIVLDEFLDKKGITWYYISFELTFKVPESENPDVQTLLGLVKGWIKASGVEASATTVSQ